MPSVNPISHREDHRNAAAQLRRLAAAVATGASPTPAEYRAQRHDVAAARREEQRRARIVADTDRATLRARRP
jgi:hypothetical protein